MQKLKPYGRVAQSVEHLTFNQVVPGSNPGTLIDAQIAQLVEQRTENPRVVGSIPTLGTQHLSIKDRCFFLPKKYANTLFLEVYPQSDYFRYMLSRWELEFSTAIISCAKCSYFFVVSMLS